MPTLTGEYSHSKTGNIYTVLDTVYPSLIPLVESDIITTQTVLCCENKEVEVKIHLINTKYYYETSANPDLHENTSIKVLYERNGQKWLRSEKDFKKLVDINNVTIPRFVRLINQN